jgi:hypothetical protein
MSDVLRSDREIGELKRAGVSPNVAHEFSSSNLCREAAHLRVGSTFNSVLLNPRSVVRDKTGQGAVLPDAIEQTGDVTSVEVRSSLKTTASLGLEEPSLRFVHNGAGT